MHLASIGEPSLRLEGERAVDQSSEWCGHLTGERSKRWRRVTGRKKDLLARTARRMHIATSKKAKRNRAESPNISAWRGASRVPASLLGRHERGRPEYLSRAGERRHARRGCDSKVENVDTSSPCKIHVFGREVAMNYAAFVSKGHHDERSLKRGVHLADGKASTHTNEPSIEGFTINAFENGKASVLGSAFVDHAHNAGMRE